MEGDDVMDMEWTKNLAFCVRCGTVFNKEFSNNEKCPMCTVIKTVKKILLTLGEMR